MTGQQGKKDDDPYSSLPLPFTHKHCGIYTQLCIWDVYLIFIITAQVTPDCYSMRFIHLRELTFDWTLTCSFTVNVMWHVINLSLANWIWIGIDCMVLQTYVLIKWNTHPIVLKRFKWDKKTSSGDQVNRFILLSFWLAWPLRE